jgi:Uma2 family endonuclease
MATVSKSSSFKNDYPTTDGKPMAETDRHRILMTDLIQTLDAFYAADPLVYVSGNLLLFYERGNKRRHLSPDVFVVKGVAKGERPNYLLWEERSPNVVIELTSSSTRHVDTKRKLELYRDRLKVGEYFLFDPFEDYLDPSMQGYRLIKGTYEPIRPVKGRLPSKALGLHLERAGQVLRLYDPVTQKWLPTLAEKAEESREEAKQARLAERRAKAEAEQAKEQQQRAKLEAEEREQRAKEQEQRAKVEIERLRAELDQLRRQVGQ